MSGAADVMSMTDDELDVAVRRCNYCKTKAQNVCHCHSYLQVYEAANPYVAAIHGQHK